MKLYYTKGACSLVVRIVIEELKLNVAFESVDLRTKKTASGINFLTINSKGAVPALELDSKEILTENAVILQYLADHAKATELLPPVDDFKRYRVLEWLNFVASELHKGIGILFNPSVTKELREQFFFPLIKTKLHFVDNHLQHHRYLTGESFTLPDAYLFVMLQWALYFKVPLESHLERYFAELQNRPSIATALKQEL